MKTMAILDENNIVVNVIVCNDDELDTPNQLTYTEANPAFIGGDYVDGYFYPEQPYPSWIRDQGKWISPIPYPDDNKKYVWNEINQTWDLVNG